MLVSNCGHTTPCLAHHLVRDQNQTALSHVTIERAPVLDTQFIEGFTILGEEEEHFRVSVAV